MQKILDKKLFEQKKCLKILASEIFCSPKILTSKLALNEENCLCPFLIIMKNTVLCVVVAVTLTVNVNKNNVFIFEVINLP